MPLSREQFHKRFEKIVFNVALRFTENHQEAEDWSAEIISGLFRKYREKQEDIKNLDAWIRASATYSCITRQRKLRKRQEAESGFERILELEKRTRQPEEIFIDKETPVDSVERLNTKLRKQIEISLEWVDSFFKLIKKIRSIRNKYQRYIDLRDELLRLERKVKRKFPLDRERIKELAEKHRKRAVKYQRIKVIEGKKFPQVKSEDMEDSEPGRIEFFNLLKIPRVGMDLDKETEEKFSFGVRTELEDYLIQATERMIYSNPVFNEFLRISPDDQDEEGKKKVKKTNPKWSFSFAAIDPDADDDDGEDDEDPFKELLFDILKMRRTIKPEKLIFAVWSRALRKGKYTNLKMIEELFLSLKERTKGTDREYLFASFKIKSLRVSHYGINRTYQKLSKFIYRKSFREKPRPEDQRIHE